MSNAAAICTSFKVEVLEGIHALGTTVVRAGTTADTLKAALYLTSGSLGSGTTAYSATAEVSGSGYSAGGITVTNATVPSSSGTTAIWTPSADLDFGTVTLTTAFDTCLIYNSTQSNKAIMVLTFGSQTVTTSDFVLKMPVNDATHALIQLT